MIEFKVSAKARLRVWPLLVTWNNPLVVIKSRKVKKSPLGQIELVDPTRQFVSKSALSYADYAIAMVDEAERTNTSDAHVRERISVVGK